MKELFLILFFSKTLLITPDPVLIFGELELRLSKRISAITPGAGLRIDLSKFAPGIGVKSTGIVESLELLRAKIPEGSVTAVLHGVDGSEILLSDTGFALTNDAAQLTLSAASGVHTGLEFGKVVIKSSLEIRDVKVYWKNFKK